MTLPLSYNKKPTKITTKMTLKNCKNKNKGKKNTFKLFKPYTIILDGVSEIKTVYNKQKTYRKKISLMTHRQRKKILNDLGIIKKTSTAPDSVCQLILNNLK